MTSNSLHGPYRKPLSGARPNALIVLLHGVGSDGDDLIELASHWSPLLPDAEFLAPNGPYPCDMAPFGRQWFSLQDRRPEALLAGIGETAPILNAYLNEALAARGLNGSRLALVGFSQGTMMALHVAPRRASQMAGVVGYSGALLEPALLTTEIRSRPPMLLIHGDADPVVPFAALANAASTLEFNQVPVETLACQGLGHSIDEVGLQRGGQFLQKVVID